MSNDRNYRAGTTEALFLLSRGHCYHPDCKHRVVAWNGNEWRKDVQVAHICGLPGGPRHNEEKSDKVNHFSNLLLMCKVHHDLVDKKPTGDDYSAELLTKWKTQREGRLADQLDQLDWITEDKLQEFMARAIHDTHGKIGEAIAKVSGVSDETLELLKRLAFESFQRPYLDTGAIESLERSATTLLEITDYIPTLERSATNLRELPDHSSMLYRAAYELRDIGDYASTLIQAADLLAHLEGRAPMFMDAAEILAHSSTRIDKFNTAVSRLSGLRFDDLAHEADVTKEAARQLKEAHASWATEDRAKIERVAQNLAIASQGPPRAGWSWRAFGIGMGACFIAVVTILILWANAAGR